MAEGVRSVRNEPLLAERPAGAVWHRIREACRRLYSVEDGFVASFRSSLASLVPELQHTTTDGGRGISEGLARAVLWAALTNDPPEVVEATFQDLGAEYCRRGFPDSGYHGAGHALLRAARDTQLSDWTSELSSGWVAYYSWLAAYLTEGARQARTDLPALPDGSVAYHSASLPGAQQPVTHQGPAGSSATGSIPSAGPPPLGLQLGSAPVAQPQEAVPALPSAGPTSGQTAMGGSPAFGSRTPSGPAASALGRAPHFPGANSDHRVPHPPTSLDEVLDFLNRRYFVGNERALGAILTRVALRTGADLRSPRPDQRTNPAVISNVLAVLQVMGYVVHTTSAEAIPPVVPPAVRPIKPTRWWNRRRSARGSQ